MIKKTLTKKQERIQVRNNKIRQVYMTLVQKGLRHQVAFDELMQSDLCLGLARGTVENIVYNRTKY